MTSLRFAFQTFENSFFVMLLKILYGLFPLLDQLFLGRYADMLIRFDMLICWYVDMYYKIILLSFCVVRDNSNQIVLPFLSHTTWSVGSDIFCFPLDILKCFGFHPPVNIMFHHSNSHEISVELCFVLFFFPSVWVK